MGATFQNLPKEEVAPVDWDTVRAEMGIKTKSPNESAVRDVAVDLSDSDSDISLSGLI